MIGSDGQLSSWAGPDIQKHRRTVPAEGYLNKYLIADWKPRLHSATGLGLLLSPCWAVVRRPRL